MHNIFDCVNYYLIIVVFIVILHLLDKGQEIEISKKDLFFNLGQYYRISYSSSSYTKIAIY